MCSRPIFLTAAVGLLIAALGPARAQDKSRRFDLPCLAPLLERIDPGAPLNLDEAFLLGPWHAPEERSGIGEVDFKIATGSADAQRWFNQGVALLHLFWYSEAERCFRQALGSDPDCPMLYWGLAMANERRPQRAAVFAAGAKRYMPNRGELSSAERGWLKILTEFYDGRRARFDEDDMALSDAQESARRRERIRSLEALAFDHPRDVEIEAFLLRQVILDQSMHGDPIASHHANDLLAAKLAAAAPRHPSRHYRLLLWLERDPRRAVAAAGEVVRSAPAVPDAWRIAGEAFRAAGDLQRATELFDGAVRLGLREVKTMPDLTENLVSNYAALVDAHTSMGRFAAARDTALTLVAMPRSFYLEKRHTHRQRLAGSYATGRRLLGQSHLRLELWEELLAACAPGGALGPGAENDWFSQTDSQFWGGIALANLDRIPEARAKVEALKNTIRKSGGLGAGDDEQHWMVALARTLRTHIEFSAGERKRVPDEAADTTWLTPDHLARLYFGAGLKTQALELIDRELARRPGQFLTVANYIDLHFRNGDSKSALFAFDEAFRKNASLATGGSEAMKRLAPVATAMRLRGRWKLAAPEQPPLPGIPPPETLGPLAWTPPESPAWELPDHAGRPTSLSTFRGKPVVVNFFLGVACPFCRVQLDKFAPQLAAYQKADIEFVAITRDPLESLQAVTGTAPEKSATGKKLLPFPVFADPEMDAFKAFRAYDEFDAFPMHATVLVDAQGRIRWSDIGHAPFNHPEALLREAQRMAAR